MKQKELLNKKDMKKLKNWVKTNSISQHKKDLLNRFNINKNNPTMEEIIMIEFFKQKDLSVIYLSSNVTPFNKKPKINKTDLIKISGDIKLEELKKLMIRCVKKYNKQKEK